MLYQKTAFCIEFVWQSLVHRVIWKKKKSRSPEDKKTPELNTPTGINKLFKTSITGNEHCCKIIHRGNALGAERCRTAFIPSASMWCVYNWSSSLDLATGLAACVDRYHVRVRTKGMSILSTAA